MCFHFLSTVSSHIHQVRFGFIRNAILRFFVSNFIYILHIVETLQYNKLDDCIRVGYILK